MIYVPPGCPRHSSIATSHTVYIVCERESLCTPHFVSNSCVQCALHYQIQTAETVSPKRRLQQPTVNDPHNPSLSKFREGHRVTRLSINTPTIPQLRFARGDPEGQCTHWYTLLVGKSTIKTTSKHSVSMLPGTMLLKPTEPLHASENKTAFILMLSGWKARYIA